MEKNKFKNFLIPSFGIAAIVTPLTTIISCGSSSTQNMHHYKLLPTYTGQADQLIALGIKPDYYPLQLDQKNPFNYLTNPSEFMKMQTDEFKNQFTKKIRSLMPSDVGTSWWNQQALSAGEKGSDPAYWQHMSGDLVMYEHYLLDDSAKAVNKSTAPLHIDSPQTYIETNFRASRDPYTRLPKKIIEALLDKPQYDNLNANIDDDSKKAIIFIKKMLETARAIEGVDIDSSHISVDDKIMPSGVPKREATDEESWIYNNYIYAKTWHTNFMDNPQFIGTSFAKWVLDQRTQSNHANNWVFDKIPSNDQTIAKLFFDATYTEHEEELKTIAPRAYGGTSALTLHHPIYEQQEEIGGAPMFEGAMRDNALYFYDTASKIQNAFMKDPNADGTKYLLETFKDDIRLPLMKEALTRANIINQDLMDRMAKLRKVINAIDNPVFGLITIAPGGGESTVQTNSKYSFLYRELGFVQPIPDLTKLSSSISNKPGESGNINNAFFNMDDNGWWWNISKDSNGHISGERTSSFPKFDLGFVTANSSQYDGVLKTDDKNTLKDMFNNLTSLDDVKVDYNLWNEGLKTPFVLHMMIDEIMKQIESKYNTDNRFIAVKSDFESAKSWGAYFTTEFVK